MAISREDKADVKGALGKAIANKVAKVTHDKSPLRMTSRELEKSSSHAYKSPLRMTSKELEAYSKKNPYAASHPYSKGTKLKPKGAPAPYPAKKAALSKRMDADRDRDD